MKLTGRLRGQLVLVLLQKRGQILGGLRDWVAPKRAQQIVLGAFALKHEINQNVSYRIPAYIVWFGVLRRQLLILILKVLN